LAKFQNGKLADSYYSLIRPPSLYIRPDFTDIHGITIEDVYDAPTFDEVWQEIILAFIGGLPLAAHNASFDMGVLKAALAWYKLSIPPLNYFCTLTLARRTWPELESHVLSSLEETFGITYNAHNALDDAVTCGDIACLASEEHGTHNLGELLSFAEMCMGRLVVGN
jgi:DNA polymerase-3 subunit epsilon